MIKLTGVLRETAKPAEWNSERLRIIHRAARDYPGYATGLLEMKFDPAFLHFIPDTVDEVARGVYCRDLASEILMDEVAGLDQDRALEELYLLLNTFEEGHSPLMD